MPVRKLLFFGLLIFAALVLGLVLGRSHAAARTANKVASLAVAAVPAAAAPLPDAPAPAGPRAVLADEQPDLSGQELHLPSLSGRGRGADLCDRRIRVQALGPRPVDAVRNIPPGPSSRILLLQWGEAVSCPDGQAVPLKVDCSGFLVPGTPWTVPASAIVPEARSASVFSLDIEALPLGTEAGAACVEIRAALTGRPDAYRRFLTAYRQGGAFPGLQPGWKRGGPLAATVERACGPASATVSDRASADYGGIVAGQAAAGRHADGSHVAWLAGLVAGSDDTGRALTELNIQNLGLDCATVEVFAHLPDLQSHMEGTPPALCEQPRRCTTLTVAPGAALQLPLTACGTLEGAIGVSVRSTELLAVVADSQDGRVMASAAAEPRGAARWRGILPALPPAWRPVVRVLNTDMARSAQVRTSLLDRSGDVVLSYRSWVCPGASASVVLATGRDLPLPWTGQLRVESRAVSPSGEGADLQPPSLIAGVDFLPPAGVDSPTPTVSALSLELEPLEGEDGPDVAVLGLPRVSKQEKGGITAQAEDGALAIANVAESPGFTDYVTYVYDAMGLLDFTCGKLHAQQVEYIDLATWGYVNGGFLGSMVISAAYWEHTDFDAEGRPQGNSVHLSAWQLRRSPSDNPARWQGAKARGLTGADAAMAAGWLGLLPRCAGGPSIFPTKTPPSATAVPPTTTPTPIVPTVTVTSTFPTPTSASPTSPTPMDRYRIVFPSLER